MDALETLQNRVNALLKRYADKQAELGQSKKESNRLLEENAALQQQLKQLEDRLLALEIGQAMPDEQSREQSRKKIDSVIGEIDKILMTLNV